MRHVKDNMRERALNIQERSLMIREGPGVGIYIEVAIQANLTSKTARWMVVEKSGLVRERSRDLEVDHQRSRALGKESTRAKSDLVIHGPKVEVSVLTTLARIQVAGATSSLE